MFWERFEHLCNNANLKVNPAYRLIFGDKKSGSPSAWKNGAIPNTQALIAIAEFFDCSIDFLLGRTDVDLKLGVGGVEQLTQDEEELLSYYRDLDRAGQRVLLGTVEEFYNSKKGTTKTDAV